MVRRWFSITALLAVAVLVLAVDAIQGRERRFGRRARNRSDANVTSAPGPYYTEWVPADSQTDGRRMDYYDPSGQGMSARARPVLLEVRVPANAEILIDGATTMQKGAVRLFISPPIEPGHYAYKIEAKWMDQGSERKQTKTVDVHAGQLVRVDLTKATQEKEEK